MSRSQLATYGGAPGDARRGRVLFIGTDTLWKWHALAGTTEGPTPYQVFWQQALRTLAPVRQSAGNVNLFLAPERSRYEPGQTVVLRAEVPFDS